VFKVNLSFFVIYVFASLLMLIASSSKSIDNNIYKNCIYYYKKVCKNKTINSPERICKISSVHRISYKKYKLSGMQKICKNRI
jgi:hypothetical protein